MIDVQLLAGKSIRETAVLLGRSPSTISRLIANHGGILHYLPKVARERAEYRRHAQGRSKIARNPTLKAFILEKLYLGWAPGVIAGRWNLDKQVVKISHESIYAWIYSPVNKHLELFKLLSRYKKKRGLQRHKKMPPIEGKALLAERPKAANSRAETGHCEADLVFWQGNQSANVLTVVDRKTRFVALKKNDSKHAHVIEEAMNTAIKKRMPFELKSFTVDNGSEFADHKKFLAPTFFCAPRSPWQKGSIEQFNGMLRRYLPFNRDIRSITQEMLDDIADFINNIPRKSLGFLTPVEAVLKHFYRKKSCVALQI